MGPTHLLVGLSCFPDDPVFCLALDPCKAFPSYNRMNLPFLGFTWSHFPPSPNLQDTIFTKSQLL